MKTVRTTLVQNRIRTMYKGIRSASNTRDPLYPMNRALGFQVVMLEGFISNSEALYFMKLLQQERWIKTIGEIGFNGGHSSYIFLKTRPDTRVLSFDLGMHNYVKVAKNYIDKQFPGRHQLVLGDSLETVPEYFRQHPETRCDLLFVDGGHSYTNAYTDLHNFEPFAHPGTLVMMDDLIPWEPWGEGPCQAWGESVAQGYIQQVGLYRNGIPVSEVEKHKGDKVWGIGRYTGATN